jgi:AraC-like DNA-binding protein/signal transduction histidine kinase
MVWDRSNRLWIGTHDGLNLLTDSSSGTFKTFTVKDGLPNNEINSMVFDRNGILWIGTSNGLCRLDVEKMEFRILGMENGLPATQFLKHAAFQLKNGDIVMGTVKGAIQFDPQKIPDESFVSKVLFQSFQLFNAEIHPSKNSFLEENPIFTQAITLNYRQNYFGINFTSLPFFSKENTSYACKLNGLDQDWQITKTNSISYTNLAPGDYLLKIKAITGSQISEERTLRITILPPWWKSQWAYWFYGIFIVVGLLIAAYLIVRIERRKAFVRLQKYKAKKEQEMNDLKFAFFSQVSNELKNPLTLLINPLNELFSVNNPEIKPQLSVMQSSAFQMNQILDQLVDFKKIGKGEYQPNLTIGNIFALLNRICLKYAACAKSGGKLFQFKISNVDTFASFDAALVCKIQGNVLDFFFNRSAENSEILFEATVISKNENSFLLISVSDQLGRLTPLQLKLLLDPFSGGESQTSSGFGLAITSELVKLCKGEMKLVNSEKGILAELKLPLIINQAKNSEKVLFENESNKPILLLVISHAEMRTFLVESFSPDYGILECEYAENAFSMIEQKWPDFVICDFELKGTNGLLFFNQFNENQKAEGIPFILLSDDDDQSVKLDALRAGVHRFIQKPFNLDELKTIVHNHFITRKKLQKELTSDSHSIQLRNVEITDPQKELLNRLLNFMEKHYADTNLNVELLCAELDMSRPQLYRKLQTLTGLSVQEFIKSFRLKKAASFLRSGDMRISDIAYQTGFSDPQHFSKSFKIQFGISPTHYAAEHKG